MYETFAWSKKASVSLECDGSEAGSFEEPESEMPRSWRMRFVFGQTKWVPRMPMVSVMPSLQLLTSGSLAVRYREGKTTTQHSKDDKGLGT